MFKGIYLHGEPHAWRGRTKFRLAAGAAALLLSASGGAFSQGVSQGPAVGVQAPQTAAEPLSLTKAIELALEGNPEVAAATRQFEATEGQVLQGRARPNPELAYSLEDARSKTRTQSWQLNLPVELGGKRAARTKAAPVVADLVGDAAKTTAARLRAQRTVASETISSTAATPKVLTPLSARR